MSVFARHEVQPIEDECESEAKNRILDLIAHSYTRSDEPVNMDGFNRKNGPSALPVWMEPIRPVTEVEAPESLSQTAVADFPTRSIVEIYEDVPEPVVIYEKLAGSQEEEVKILEVSPRRIGLNGLKKAMPALRRARAAISSARQKTADAYTMANVHIMNSIRATGEYIADTAKNKRNHKLAGAVIGIAAVGVGAYFASRGFSSGGSPNRLQEAVPTHLPIAPKAHNVEVLNQVQAAPKAPFKEATHGISTAVTVHVDKVSIKPGEGLSQIIKDEIPGKSAGQYGEAAKAAFAKFGSHAVEGISKYRMGDHSWGFSHPGNGYWGPHVKEFIKNYLNSKH